MHQNSGLMKIVMLVTNHPQIYWSALIVGLSSRLVK